MTTLRISFIVLFLSIVMPTASASAATSAPTRNSSLGTLHATLLNPLAPKAEWFGASVGISGTTAIVSSIGSADASYIYVKDASGGWPSKPTLTLNDPGATYGQFGYSVAISGDTIIVGAPVTNGNSGAAYIYVKGASGWPTTPTATLADPAATAQDSFGISVAISGTTAIVGAPQDVSPYNENAYIYAEGASGWPTTPTATLADPTGPANTDFGAAVALSGNTAVVGGDDESLNSPSTPPAYIYAKGASGWPTTPTTTLVPPAAKRQSEFGFSVAVSGTTVMVGAPNIGSTYSYVEGASGWPSTPTTTLVDPGRAGKRDFGYSVAVLGKTAIVGDPGGTDAYIYVKRTSGWPREPTADMPAPGGEPDFGCSVAITKTIGIVGADDIHSFSGAAYIYSA